MQQRATLPSCQHGWVYGCNRISRTLQNVALNGPRTGRDRLQAAPRIDISENMDAEFAAFATGCRSSYSMQCPRTPSASNCASGRTCSIASVLRCPNWLRPAADVLLLARLRQQDEPPRWHLSRHAASKRATLRTWSTASTTRSALHVWSWLVNMSPATATNARRRRTRNRVIARAPMRANPRSCRRVGTSSQ